MPWLSRRDPRMGTATRWTCAGGATPGSGKRPLGWRHQAGAPRNCPVRQGKQWPPPAKDDPPPTPEQVAELIALARRIGAEVMTLEAGQTVEVIGGETRTVIVVRQG